MPYVYESPHKGESDNYWDDLVLSAAPPQRVELGVCGRCRSGEEFKFYLFCLFWTTVQPRSTKGTGQLFCIILSQYAPRLGNVMQMTKGAPSDLFNM